MPDVTAQIKAPQVTPATAAQALVDSGITTANLEDQVIAILARRKAAAAEAARPKEPDWKNLSERDAYAADVYIPVIEHEEPDYMNIKLKDTEYEVVWASRDQRRLGQLMATGYEMLKPEHVAVDFKMPLLFDSEKLYVYMDVVAMRVHKRILYGKRKRALQVSLNQLSNRNRPPRVRVKDSFDLSNPVSAPAGHDFYESMV